MTLVPQTSHGRTFSGSSIWEALSASTDRVAYH